jgi:hypothetical protein
VSNLGDLGAALSISGEPTLLKVAKSRELATVTKGSVGSLEPLRQRLLGFLSEARCSGSSSPANGRGGSCSSVSPIWTTGAATPST